MEIRRLRTLAVEIFKTLNEINPSYIKNIFTPKENSKVRYSYAHKYQQIWYPKLKVLWSKNMEQPVIKYKIKNIPSKI